MKNLTADQVKPGDRVRLTYTQGWDGEAIVLFVSENAFVRLHMTTGTYAGAEGTFDWRDNDWTITKIV